VRWRKFCDSQGNRCCRLVAPAGESHISLSTVVADSGQSDAVVPSAWQMPWSRCRPMCCPFLNASRYCENATG